MTIEIFAFFLVAASLILAGFASGPLIARRVDSSDRRRSYR